MKTPVGSPSLLRRTGLASACLLGGLVAPTLASAAGLFVSFYHSDTVGYYETTNGVALNPTFASVQSPLGLAVGPEGTLYVGSDSLAAAGAGVVSFSLNGTNSVPRGVFASHIDNNALNNPQGLAFAGGNLYIADVTSSEIFVYTNASPTTGRLAQTLSSDSPSLSQPEGLAVDSHATLYVANEGLGNILAYTGSGFAQVNAASVLYNMPHDVVPGPDGFVYVLDISPSGGISRLDPQTGASTLVVDYSTVMFQANDLAMGPEGKLYVSGQDLNTAQGEIRRYNLDGTGETVAVQTGFATSPGFMAFAPAALVPPNFLSANVLPDHNFGLTFTGPEGQPYTVVATSDLRQPLAGWTTLTNATFGAAPATYTDLGATNFPHRFYRLVSP